MSATVSDRKGQKLPITTEDKAKILRKILEQYLALVASELTQAKKDGIDVNFSLAPDADGVFKSTLRITNTREF